jgi:hypothetical protein
MRDWQERKLDADSDADTELGAKIVFIFFLLLYCTAVCADPKKIPNESCRETNSCRY